MKFTANRTSYHILKPARHKLKIRGSTFIGSATSVTNSQEAELYIEGVRREFFKATHNCFAYRIDSNQYRFSDDGEPSGTAGRPILTALEKFDLEQTALVVSRFFGGIKLSRGGLMRAYAQCAEETIQKAGRKEVIPHKQIRISYPYDFTRTVEGVVKKYSGKIESRDFSPHGSVGASIRVPQEHYSQFMGEILNLGYEKIEIMER